MTWLYVSMSAMLLKGVNTNTVFVMSNIADILQRSPVDFSGSRVTCLVAYFQLVTGVFIFFLPHIFSNSHVHK